MSFAAVPLYRAFCAATGFAGTTQVRHVAPTTEGKRIITVHFDANVAPGLALALRAGNAGRSACGPARRRRSSSKSPISPITRSRRGAVYNVTPGQTGAYFDKIACFCFSEQHLGPHETAEMPVVFFLDPALEKDETMSGIDEVTLSYTFYPAQDATACRRLRPQASEPPAALNHKLRMGRE